MGWVKDKVKAYREYAAKREADISRRQKMKNHKKLTIKGYHQHLLTYATFVTLEDFKNTYGYLARGLTIEEGWSLFFSNPTPLFKKLLRLF